MTRPPHNSRTYLRMYKHQRFPHFLCLCPRCLHVHFVLASPVLFSPHSAATLSPFHGQIAISESSPPTRLRSHKYNRRTKFPDASPEKTKRVSEVYKKEMITESLMSCQLHREKKGEVRVLLEVQRIHGCVVEMTVGIVMAFVYNVRVTPTGVVQYH